MKNECNHYHRNHAARRGQTIPKCAAHDENAHRAGRDEKARDDAKSVLDRVLEDMAAEMDDAYMSFGKTIAELFRAMCEAAAKLPNIELKTDMLTICNDDDCLSVSFTHDPLGLDEDDDEHVRHCKVSFCGVDDEYDDDDEEGYLYDGD